MQVSLPFLAIVLLCTSARALPQNDLFDDIVSQALDVVPQVKSALDEPPNTASSRSRSARSSATSTSAPSSSTTASAESSTDGSSTSTGSSATSSAAASETSAAAAPPSNGGDSTGKTLGIALGVSLGVLTSAILLGLIFCCWRRRQRRQRSKLAHESQRSLSPEAVGSGRWRKSKGKGPISHPTLIEKSTPGAKPFSSHDNHTPNGASILPMTENHNPSVTNSSMPYGGASNLHPHTPHGPAATQHSPLQPSNHTPSASHSGSKSTAAAAGLGGAALGGMAANHHHNNHSDASPAHHHNHGEGSSAHHHPHHNESERGILRKPVGGMHSSNPDSHRHSHPANSISPETVGSSGGLNSTSSVGSSGPPPYHGNSSLMSHPPSSDSQGHSSGRDTMMAGAAGAMGAAAGGVAANRHHDSHHARHRESDPLLGSRNSMDNNRQPQNHHHPPSILSNVAGRRHTGSSNAHIPPRSAGKARFSDNVDIAEMPAHRGQDDDQAANQSGPYPGIEQPQRPRPLHPSPERRFSSGSTPGHMPGSWGGSCDWGQNNRRGSFSHDDLADSRHRGQSFTSLRQQEEDAWYRGRQMSGGAGRPGFPDRPRYDSRFYAGKGVGQPT